MLAGYHISLVRAKNAAELSGHGRDTFNFQDMIMLAQEGG
jgi:hypothetical protein